MLGASVGAPAAEPPAIVVRKIRELLNRLGNDAQQLPFARKNSGHLCHKDSYQRGIVGDLAYRLRDDRRFKTPRTENAQG